ncbi:MAG: hypothetical protein V3R25_05980 [Nitrosomonadaceae bacterium]
MTNFIVSEFFKTRAKIFKIEGVEFELMGLTNSLIEDIKNCESYDAMLDKAADYGLSCDNNRVMDDEELAEHVAKLWKLGQLDISCDPCVKYQVGEFVCEISGITDVLMDQLEREKLADEDAKRKASADAEPLEFINGDEEIPSILIDELNNDATAHNNAVNSLS